MSWFGSAIVAVVAVMVAVMLFEWRPCRSLCIMPRKHGRNVNDAASYDDSAVLTVHAGRSDRQQNTNVNTRGTRRQFDEMQRGRMRHGGAQHGRGKRSRGRRGRIRSQYRNSRWRNLAGNDIGAVTNKRQSYVDTDGRRSIPLTLVMGLLTVSLKQGASIPRALDDVGEILDDGLGDSLRTIAAALNRGTNWSAAWSVHDRGPHAKAIISLGEALESSWRQGVSPLGRLEAAIEQQDTNERSTIEQTAAKLSVQLLMPTGLCFLPAFVFLGIIPSVISFIV